MSEKEGHSITVLLVEDDAAIRHLLRNYLRDGNYRLIEAVDAREGVDTILEKRPDLILLDLGLPDADGLSVIKAIREWSTTPIIVISGRGQEEQKVECLEAGADDYVTKPFGVQELQARMKVALRHVAHSIADEPVFEAGPLRVDLAARRVWSHDKEIKLSPLEYKLLTVLIKYCGKVVTQRQLLSEVWGNEYTEDSQYLRVYMGYLRKKLEEAPDSPRLILTEHRVGYRLAL